MVSRTILSTNGFEILVDDQDFEWLAQFNWYAQAGGYRYKHTRYARLGFGRSRFGKDLLMHRMICHAPPRLLVDHANGNGLDNRRENLRWADAAQNSAHKLRLPMNLTGLRGVTWHRGSSKWQAVIQVRRQSFYLGLFASKEEAARAYEQEARVRFGEFAAGFTERVRKAVQQ